MSSERADLLARVLAFDIDGGEVALPFAARLARENGWSRPYADRVIEEYKRFVFLATTGVSPSSSGSSPAQSTRDEGLKACPSEDVDAAWHLHLTYTKSYWKRFCGEVLGRPLHHEPTKGGPAEGEKHLKMYADTLAAYRDAFGHSAPADVWPAAAERFGEDMHHRAVNTARNWVIPKAPVKRAAALTLALAVVAVLVPGCEGGPNPYTLKNNDFLIVLALSMVGAVCFGRVLRSVLRKPNPVPEDEAVELDWEQTAYLAGGAGRLTTAAVARVVGRGLAKVGLDSKTLRRAGPVPDDASPVEKAVLVSLPVTNETTALKPVQDAVEAAFAARSGQMEQDGWTLSVMNRLQIGLATLIPLALVLLCLALPRLLMGMQAKKPTGNLETMMLAGGIFALLLTIAGSLRLSNRGSALLEKQIERHEALKSGTRWEHSGEAGMAVALFGTAVLAGTTIAPLQTWYPRQTSEASSGGCSSGCGSGCGGGGGCGGGD